jgi:hypothetical protein
MIYLRSINRGVFLLLTVTFLPITSWCAESLPHPDQYLPHINEVLKVKKTIDDPADVITTYALKDAVHPEIYNFLTFDVEDAKRQTAEILGFRSPDLVGKIAPEIKPGRYTYKDLEKYPGLKELFPPEFLRHIKPGGPPLIGSVPEFEIIPTRQLYWYLNLCKMTKQNLGKTKLDKDGYIVPASWEGGYPFPKPSGKFKAQQLYYNFDKRVGSFDTCFTTCTESMAFDKNLNKDKYNQSSVYNMRFMGRTLFPPYGWFDEQAKRNGKFRSYLSVVRLPRSMSGMVVLNHKYDDPDKMDQWMIYAPSLRRIRKMNPTDTQDPSGDLAYDDIYHIAQKITPKRYPYKFEIIEEREYLMPIAYNTAKTWVDSKNGYTLREVQFMRRPCYVLQMTQLDPNYIYSKRVIYIDKENFLCALSANYDQKQRLYRTQIRLRTFIQEIAQLILYGTQAFQLDHLDLHSTFQTQVHFPAPFERKDFTIQNLTKRGK